MCTGVFVTGCVKASSALMKRKYTIVHIGAVVPTGFKGEHYPRLSPPQELSDALNGGLINQAIFNMLFRKYLDSLDAKQVVRELRRMSPLNDLVALVRDGQFDYNSPRYLVGKWLSDHGYPAPEDTVDYLKDYKQAKLF